MFIRLPTTGSDLDCLLSPDLEYTCVIIMFLSFIHKCIVYAAVFRGVFQSLVTKHFPSEKQRREKAPGNKRKRKWAETVAVSVE